VAKAVCRLSRFLWQLPQALLGYILLFIYRKNIVDVLEAGSGGDSIFYTLSDVYIVRGFLGGGISLGPVILVSPECSGVTTVNHERGHSIQSLFLGPLYLLVVGVPSLTMNLLSLLLFRMGYPKFAENYYLRWPESWADRLAGIEPRKAGV
jgi:hypothetical protein